MSELLAKDVRAALRRLSVSQPPVFGAIGHRFALNPPLAENEVRAFEQCYRITLPSEYRDFIASIGNGGAGPYYGVYALGIEESDYKPRPWHENDGLVGIPAEPFPHRKAWNDLAGKPPDDLSETDEAEYERLMDAFEDRYCGSAIVNGAIPICHMGCALRIWLVVTGDERGHLWYDRRAQYAGLSPILLSDGTPATFSSWYREWLDQCLATL